MPSRRSHHKSRRGCLTCKQRRVKCDEKGPPCGSCRLRATTCEYASPVSSLHASPRNGSSAPVSDVPGDAHVDEPAFPEETRLLELQLMNRWSTVTYKSCCTKVAEDDHVWRRKVPEMSLQHDFLLNGIFALSAFEIASSSERDRARYLSAAVEYEALALLSFRPQLQEITQDSFDAVFCFSLGLMVLALASAQFTSESTRGGTNTMVQHTITHFELLRGCTTVMASKANFIAESPYIQKLKRFEDLPREALDSRTELALARLNEANENRMKSGIGEAYEHRVTNMVYREACKRALSVLQECFAKCVDIDYQGYALGWLNLSGNDFIEAIKAHDGIALLILMYWGVLVQKLGYQVWWARDFGSRLVEDIAHELLDGDTDALTKQIVSSAREHIHAVVNDEVRSQSDTVFGPEA